MDSFSYPDVQEVPATFFLCKDHKHVRSALEVNGVVTLEDPTLTVMVTAEVAAAATQYGQEYGQPIFQFPKRGPNGDFCYDATDGGRLLMDCLDTSRTITVQHMSCSEELVQSGPMTRARTGAVVKVRIE